MLNQLILSAKCVKMEGDTVRLSVVMVADTVVQKNISRLPILDKLHFKVGKLSSKVLLQKHKT